MEQQTRKNFLINTLYFLTIAVSIVIICRFCLLYLMPFIIGSVIAYAVQKPAEIISRKTGLKQSFSAAALALSVFIVLAGAAVFLILRLFVAATDAFTDSGEWMTVISSALESFKNSVYRLIKDMPEDFSSVANIFLSDSADRIIAALGSAVSSFTGTVVKAAPAFLLSTVVSAVASSYIAADFGRLLRFVRELVGKKIYSNILKIKDILKHSVFSIIKGYLFLMLITFAELFIGLSVLKLKYSFILALLISLIDLLPVLGTGTVLIPWAAVELVLGNNLRGIGLIVLYALILVVRNFSEPKIISRQIGIAPLFTLLSMFIGLKLLGFAGVIILPVTLIVVIKYYKKEMEDTFVNSSENA